MTFTVRPSFARPSYASNPTTAYVTNSTLTYATTSLYLVAVCLATEERNHYVKPAVTLKAIVPWGTLPPYTQPLQCNHCIHLGIPCVVTATRGPFKPVKCDGCTISGNTRLFSLMFLSPLSPQALKNMCEL